MGVPFDPKPTLVALANNGKVAGVVLDHNRRGIIRRFRAVQLSESLDGFTFALYSRYEAMRAAVAASWGSAHAAFAAGALPSPPSGVGFDADTDTADGTSLDPDWDDAQATLYLVAPMRAVAGSSAQDDPNGFGLELGYANNDAFDAQGRALRSTQQPRYLYLVITPGGSGTASPAKTFGIDLCTEEPTNL